MIVRNRKNQNPIVLCDVVGCGEGVPLYVSLATNPKLSAWRSLGIFGQEQVHFCSSHAAVMLDAVLSIVPLAAGAAEGLKALVVVGEGSR